MDSYRHISDGHDAIKLLEHRTSGCCARIGNRQPDQELLADLLARHGRGDIATEIANGFEAKAGMLAANNQQVTTQPGLNLLQQLRIDAFNFDQMKEAREEQRLFDAEQESAWLEFEAKRPLMARLTREAVAKE